MDLALALLGAFALVVVSAAFSGTEVALFSLRRLDREQMARSGRPADARVLALIARPKRLIATVLIGNETVNGSLVVLALGLVARYLTPMSALASAAVAAAMVIPVVVLLGEVTPKTLALKAPSSWARAAAWPLTLFFWLVSPIRFFVHGASELLLGVLGVSGRPRPGKDLTEEEFRSLLDAGSAQGQVDQRERKLIHRVFEFADKNVGQVMTPRDKIFAVSYDLPTGRLAKEVAARGFSRVPIYQKSLDNIRGVLNAKDLVGVATGAAPAPAGRTLAEMLHEPLFLPRTTPIKRAFLLFKQKKVHLGIVVNEYGGVLGLVTLDDVLGQLFGALRDEREALQASGKRGRGGRTPVPGLVVGSGLTPPPGSLSPVEAPAPAVPDPAEAAAPSDPAAGVASAYAAALGAQAEALAAPATRAGAGDVVADGAPVPITDADTGPSGPNRTSKAGQP
ncbi:MAG: HlyC/CorC family transporter [Kofleriaceae bacterium]|jgi:putative hemolysin|nr:HlyC/CorC family transporter [Kofleriaceae bacterium]